MEKYLKELNLFLKYIILNYDLVNSLEIIRGDIILFSAGLGGHVLDICRHLCFLVICMHLGVQKYFIFAPSDDYLQLNNYTN